MVRKIPIIKEHASEDFIKRQLIYLKTLKKKKKRDRQIMTLLQVISILSLILVFVFMNTDVLDTGDKTTPNSNIRAVHVILPDKPYYANGSYVLVGIILFNATAREDYVSVDQPNTDISVLGNVIEFRTYYPSLSDIPEKITVKVLGKEYTVRVNKDPRIEVVSVSYPEVVRIGEPFVVHILLKSKIWLGDISIRINPPIRFNYFLEHYTLGDEHYYNIYVLLRHTSKINYANIRIIAENSRPIDIFITPSYREVEPQLSIQNKFSLLVSGLKNTSLLNILTNIDRDDLRLSYDKSLISVESYKEKGVGNLTLITYKILLTGACETPTISNITITYGELIENIPVLVLPDPHLHIKLIENSNGTYNISVDFRDDVYSLVVDDGRCQYPVEKNTSLYVGNTRSITITLFYGGIELISSTPSAVSEEDAS